MLSGRFSESINDSTERSFSRLRTDAQRYRSMTLTRPNILLITIDALRADVLNCYGYPQPTTPHIDKLAAAGVQFEQAITAGTWTQAAFPALLTSTYPAHYGGCLGALSEQRPSPVETLRQNGYTTAGFSTNPHLSKRTRYDRGFGHFVDFDPGERDPSLRKMRGGERLLRSRLTHQLAALVGQRLRPARLYQSGAVVVDHVVDWLASAPPPFFAWIHFMDVHWPYHRMETFRTPDEIVQVWRDLAHLHQVSWHGARITPAQKERYRNLYLEGLRFLDQQIGRLLDALAELNLLDTTAIVLTADHGEEFLERGRWGHFEDNLHDEIIRVPLLVQLPGREGPRRVSHQVSTLDIMPTLLDLAGCQPPQEIEGASLRPFWDGQAESYGRKVALSEMPREHWHMVAVRTNAHKYIWDSRSPEQPRLYDLTRDPGETSEISRELPALCEEMQAYVDAHRARIAATAPAAEEQELELDQNLARRLRGLGYLE